MKYFHFGKKVKMENFSSYPDVSYKKKCKKERGERAFLIK